MTQLFRQLDATDFLTFVIFPLFPLAGWILFCWLTFRGKRPLPFVKRTEVPWGAIDVVLLLGSMMMAKILAQVVALVLISAKTGLPLDQIKQKIAFENAEILIGCGILFSILQLVLAAWYLKKIQGASWQDLGLDVRSIRKQICVGLVGSLLIVPLVLVTNAVIHTLLQVRYEHNVMTLVQFSLIASAISTVIIAPLVEEFHFRIVLQGILERVHALTEEKKVRVIQGDRRADFILHRNERSDSGTQETVGDRPSGQDDVQQKGAESSRAPWWPILVSSLFFAAVHAGQGAAPIALFLLAVFLGTIYRATHSLIPIVIVHGLLNLWSFTALLHSLD